MSNPSKQKGTGFETRVLRYIRQRLNVTDDRIHRNVLHGNKDVGDIGGVTIRGEACVIEVKNHKQFRLSQWLTEAAMEMVNAEAPYYVVIHHRNGIGVAHDGEQYVTMPRVFWERWAGRSPHKKELSLKGTASMKRLNGWMRDAEESTSDNDVPVVLHTLRKDSPFGDMEFITTTLDGFCKMIGEQK